MATKKGKQTKSKLNREAQRQVTEQEARVSNFVSALRRFLNRNLSIVLEELEGDKYTAKEAARVLGGLESAVQDAGLSEQFGKIRELFDERYEAIQEEFKATTGKAALLSNFTQQNLNTLVDERLLMASTYVTDYIGDIRSIVLESIVAGRKIKAREVLDTAEGRALANIETEVNTTLMAYQRALHLEKAEKAGTDKFLYVGPDDDITRPFCQEHVDQIFTRDEIDNMDNGTDLPVSLFCGGYNCRHHWRPVSDELAAEIEGEDSEQ
ncbi:MAG: hypothetical protein E6R03_09245 [Hyphomicrobiaceae bacterium]|nr:MAG: hypothetical protein E6R03_09245 [Hyphomicrobiaceae bacterium]